MSRASEAVKRWRRNGKERIIQAMGGKCAICNYSQCHDALELHHLDPSEKEFGLGSIRANPKNWATVCAELRKCVMLCANCHREVHAGMIDLDQFELPKFDENYASYQREYSVPRTYNGKTIHPREKTYIPCPVCGTEMQSDHKVCSTACAGMKRRRISDEDVLALHQDHPNTQVAEMLGVSEAAIRKRLKRLERKRKLKDSFKEYLRR